jgi:hypothetical protein
VVGGRRPVKTFLNNHQPPTTNHRFKKKGCSRLSHFLESDICEQP